MATRVLLLIFFIFFLQDGFSQDSLVNINDSEYKGFWTETTTLLQKQHDFFDKDLFKLTIGIIINTLFLFILIRIIYYPKNKKSEYLFTYFLISTVIFFVCFSLKKLKLDMGLALGLFAIFSIIRYRTTSMPIKEMTYLFVVVGMAIINALSGKRVSWLELIVINIFIILITLFMEMFFYKKNKTQKENLVEPSNLSTQDIIYDRLYLLKPNNKLSLMEDLKNRTGLDIQKIVINKINYKEETANLKVYFPLDTDTKENQETS